MNRKFLIITSIIFLILSLSSGVYASNEKGVVTSFTIDKPTYEYGEYINVSSSLRAITNIKPNSKITYGIYYPWQNPERDEPIIYVTSPINVPLNPGQTINDNNQIFNNVTPGNYIVAAVWWDSSGIWSRGHAIDYQIRPIVLTPAYPHGTITELTPIGAPYPTTGPVQFRCVLRNVGNIPLDPSINNLTITYGSDFQYINSTVYNVPALAPGESFTYIWNTTNANFPYNSYQTGSSYSINSFWIYSGNGFPGADFKSTTFYSVPSPWFIVAIAGFLTAIAGFARKKRWWLSFYLAGAVAVVALIISFFTLTGYDNYVMGIEAENIAYFASLCGITSNFLPPNAFIFPDPTGWSIFGIGFECSSIIEISVLVGLLLLYPGYNWRRKVKYVAIGITVTYAANLIRMLSIIYIVNIFGKNSLYFAHAFIGKIIFFAFVVLLYWYLLTRPTLDIVRDNIKSGKFEH